MANQRRLPNGIQNATFRAGSHVVRVIVAAAFSCLLSWACDHSLLEGRLVERFPVLRIDEWLTPANASINHYKRSIRWSMVGQPVSGAPYAHCGALGFAAQRQLDRRSTSKHRTRDLPARRQKAAPCPMP